jgi:hypothetical protein
MSITHSPYFLSLQAIFLQLSGVQFLPLLLQENAESFIILKVVYHITFCGVQWNSLTSILRNNILVLISVPLSNWEYFPKSVSIVATIEFPTNTVHFTQ